MLRFTPVMDSESREAFERDGFVVVRQLLAPAELDELRRELDRYIREVLPGLSFDHKFYHDRARPETLKQMQHMQDDAFFGAYVRHPKWVAVAETLLGEEAHSESPEWFNKPAGTNHFTPPHQDNYYFCLRPPSALTVWLALDPVDRENGCLRYVVGSHRRGIRPHAVSNVLGFSQAIVDYGPDDRAREVEIHLAPGDAVAHHCELIHLADANRSPVRQRRAFAMVFHGASARRDPDAFARYQSAVAEQHRELGLTT